MKRKGTLPKNKRKIRKAKPKPKEPTTMGAILNAPMTEKEIKDKIAWLEYKRTQIPHNEQYGAQLTAYQDRITSEINIYRGKLHQLQSDQHLKAIVEKQQKDDSQNTEQDSPAGNMV